MIERVYFQDRYKTSVELREERKVFRREIRNRDRGIGCN